MSSSSGSAVDALGALSLTDIMRRAYERHLIIPAFNIAHVPMLRPIVDTLKETGSFALVEVARPDIEQFGAESYAAVAAAFARHADRRYTRLHQDHVPVIDERQQRVDWRSLINEALRLQYDSVMIDGSRLSLHENITLTREVVRLAHPRAAVEAELGAVLGHEAGPLPPYEELFDSGQGFTNVEDAQRFARETDVDWLSVAIGNIHGAISGAAKDAQKLQARLNIGHLRALSEAVGIPLVLHGGTGIDLGCVREAIANGIAKINVGTAVRQAYETVLREGGDVARAQAATAQSTRQHLEDYQMLGSAERLVQTT
ncbi:class II fructose-bisphosphate aldolase [bacterium]|nr:class II fructose-bisphosphate aldolase [bacterium]